MTRVDLRNGLAAFLCLTASVAAATLLRPPPASAPIVAPAPAPAPGSAPAHVELPDGRRALVDATGTPVPIDDRGRIVSGNTVADWILVELCDRRRIAAVTRRSARDAPWRHKFGGLPTVADLGDIEAVLGHRPDLVVAASFGDPRRLARLREAGVAVFDLGQMTGLDSLLVTIRTLGTLVGHPDRAEELARQFERNLTALARDVPPGDRPRAVYVAAYGRKLYGGTVGTAYHDILRSAGLIDAAAGRFRGWPEYSAQELLGLDPDLVVTHRGMGRSLCRLPGVTELRACRTAGGVIELDSFALGDPGQGMLQSAEALHEAVHGQARPKPAP